MQSPSRYRVIFQGEILAGKNIVQVKQGLAALFKCDAALVERLFSDRPVVIKDHVTREVALQYQQAFRQVGAVCRFQEFSSGHTATRRAQRKPSETIKPHTVQTQANPPNAPPASETKDIDRETSFSSLLESYRAKVHNSNVVLLAPHISEERLASVAQRIVSGDLSSEEQALVLVDLKKIEAGLLLTDRKLYLRKAQTPPRRIQLASIKSVSVKDRSMYLNGRNVFAFPAALTADMTILSDLLMQVATHATSHRPEKQNRAESQAAKKAPPQQSGAKKKMLFAATALTFVIVVAGMLLRSQLSAPPQAEQVEPSSTETPVQAAPPHASTLPVTSQQTNPANPVDNKGAACKYHDYRFRGGTGATLTFSRKFPPYEDEFAPKVAVETPLNYVLQENPVQSYGIAFGFPVMSYAQRTLSHQVWAVDGRKLFTEIRNDPSYDASKEWPKGGVPTSIPLVHIAGAVKIRWQPDGYAVFEELGKLRDKVEIGKLTGEELRLRISPGSVQPQIRYTMIDLATEKSFDLPAVQIQQQETVTIQALEVYVSTPTTVSEQHRCEYINFMPAQSEGTHGKNDFEIELCWYIANKDNNLYFNVKGPAVTTQCFQ